MAKNPKKITYCLAVYQDAETKLFWTTFADFDCLVDQGETVEDAIHQSTLFLESVVEDMVENNQEFPEASSILDFKKKLDPADGEPICIVPVTVYPPAKMERINISMKGDVLARIDDFAKKKNLNRSKLMVNATLAYMQQS